MRLRALAGGGRFSALLTAALMLAGLLIAASPGSAGAVSTMVPQLAVGQYSTSAMFSDNDVRCSGFNSTGVLGNGTGTDSMVPVSVNLGGRQLTQVTGGVDHMCGLTTAGTVYCWGQNGSGQFGDNSPNNYRPSLTPMTMPGGVTFTAISAASGRTCALDQAGTVWCAGNNGNGQIGDGSTTQRRTPAQATMPGGVTFNSISVGVSATCALTSGGVAYCWGSGVQVGDGAGTTRLTPTAVTMPGGVTFTSISVADQHVCALTTTKVAYCWGSNQYAAVGDGTFTTRLIPTAVTMPGGVTFDSISVNGFHSCGLSIAGAAYCWGYNFSGEVGDGSFLNRSTPTLVTVPGATPLTSIASGNDGTCATSARGIICWGNDSFGQFGDGVATQRNYPAPVSTPGGKLYKQIATGDYFTCALQRVGAVDCWGYNANGQLGDGTLAVRATPTPLAFPGGVTPAYITTGSSHACALDTAGLAYCWGGNLYGQIGDGSLTQRLTPTAVTMPGGVTFKQIAAGSAHTCALSVGGVAYCWGAGANGRLGDSTGSARYVPTMVTMPSGRTFTSISAGGGHSCAITDIGTEYCWGYNNNGQVGDGSSTDRNAPVAVTMPGAVSFVQTSLGLSFTCANSDSGAVFCWGLNSNGQLGDNSSSTRLIPVATAMPGGSVATAISAGSVHACATIATGAGYCWGANYFGNLGGTAITYQRATPSAVTMPNGAAFTSVAGGLRHTCALASTGIAYCWGANAFGQLGDNGPIERVLPIFSGILGAVQYTNVNAIVDATLTFVVGGHSGTCNGILQTGSGAATGVSLGHATTLTGAVAAQDLSVTTNAAIGFTVFARYGGVMSDGNGHTIVDIGGSNSSPTAFPSAGTAGFGYTTNASLSGTANRFTNPSANWAAMTTSNAEVGYASVGPVTAQTSCVAYQLGASSTTPAGSYSTTVIYTAVPLF